MKSFALVNKRTNDVIALMSQLHISEKYHVIHCDVDFPCESVGLKRLMHEKVDNNDLYRLMSIDDFILTDSNGEVVYEILSLEVIYNSELLSERGYGKYHQVISRIFKTEDDRFIIYVYTADYETHGVKILSSTLTLSHDAIHAIETLNATHEDL